MGRRLGQYGKYLLFYNNDIKSTDVHKGGDRGGGWWGEGEGGRGGGRELNV